MPSEIEDITLGSILACHGKGGVSSSSSNSNLRLSEGRVGEGVQVGVQGVLVKGKKGLTHIESNAWVKQEMRIASDKYQKRTIPLKAFYFFRIKYVV